MIPWIFWSILYIAVAVGCCTYELTLGGTIIEMTIPPIIYLTVIGCWMYTVLCVYSYYKTLSVQLSKLNLSNADKTMYELEAEQARPLVLSLRQVTEAKIYPRAIWEDESSVSNFSDGRRLSSRSVSLYKEPVSFSTKNGANLV
jgi:hypothetical protein